MPSDTIICRRCGVSNTAGDQFCGSCGAFLEWEGDEAPPPSEQEAPPPTDFEVEPAAPEPTPAPTPEPPRPPQDVPAPMPGFSVCPTCGSGNPPGRTFCHQCGNLLSKDASTAKAGPDGDRSGEERSRGVPGWLPLVVGAGLIVGIAVILVTVVFKPAAPPSAAVPSATLTPTLAVPPSVSVPPASVAGSLAPSGPPASVGAGGAVQLTLSGAAASSVTGDTPDVAAINVIDGRLDTRWQEAVGAPPGEWVEITFPASQLEYVVVYSGFQLSHDSFLATKRPQNVVVTVNGGAPVGFVLADSELPQRIDVDDAAGATVVRLQVTSTFPASASAYPGSPIDAAAISEIRAFGVAGG